uniref:non-specific serine/threonine protein kinase n=2 Tax=Nelumbo nucifera TaxID=4432 RepID=A0A822XSA6_NELNU|nr:TPA_asm: hypothetical protein HUJ06_023168 [Nelumbo nucifera]
MERVGLPNGFDFNFGRRFLLMASSPETATSPETSSSSSSPTTPSPSSSPPAPPKSSAQSPSSSTQKPQPPSTTESPPSPSSNKNRSPPSPSSSSDAPPPPPPPRQQSSSTPSSSSSSSGALSPPSTPKQKTPSSSGSRSPTHSESSSHNSSSAPLLVGLAVTAMALLLIMIVVCVCLSNKRKRRPQNQLPYYTDPPFGHKGNAYYNGTPLQNWQYNSPLRGDHIVKIPPPPGFMGSPAAAGWHAAPPPPPPATSSGDLSSTSSGPHNPPLPPPSPCVALGFINQSTFSYEELAAATGGFSEKNLLGQGGFGHVHKGVLPNGKEIAVKSLKSGSGQGEREFQAEVEIISRVHHRHLVSLVGYCMGGGHRILVYQFVPNGTLEYHLHGKDRPTMDWPTRLRIALGSAKGLAYLHEDCHPRIIHRDIKTANILLDNNFEAMVADFGLAKLSSDKYTHISTRVMGTFGYLAPEYASSGKLTEKSDVFSFGVMLLELITGRRPVDTANSYMDDSLVDWARPILTHVQSDGNYGELVDPRLENNYNPSEMARMVACATASIRHSARRRPKMSQIVRVLEGDVSLDDLNEGIKPSQSAIFGSNGGASD